MGFNGDVAVVNNFFYLSRNEQNALARRIIYGTRSSAQNGREESLPLFPL